MADDDITLNPGAGGEILDTEGVSYPGPVTKHRERIEVTGEGIDDIAPVLNTDPAADAYGLTTRNLSKNSERDIGNSTTTQLGIGASFTGTWFDTIGFNGTLGHIRSSALLLGHSQWSDDGITVVHELTLPFQGAGAFSGPREGRYFRLVLDNLSGAPTTDLMVDLYHTRTPSTGLIAPLIAPPGAFHPAMLTKAIIAGQRRNDSQFTNVGLSPIDGLFVRDERQDITESGSLFTEGIVDHVSHIFSRDKQTDSILRLVDVSAGGGGTVLADPVEGQAIFATPVAAGSVCYFETAKTLRYDFAAHTLRFEQTVEALLTAFVGVGADAVIDWGAGEDDGAGNILNGIHWRIRVAAGVPALFVCRTKGGVLVSETPQASFNRDMLDGAAGSLFRFGGMPQAIDVSQNNYYLGHFEWLGVAPPKYSVQSPTADIIEVHIEEFPNQGTGTTLAEPNVPLFLRIANDSIDGGVIEVRSGSWRGGTHTNQTVITGQQPDGDFETQPLSGSDPGNTTTTPLGIGGVFLGVAFDATGFTSALVSVKSDVVSATNGLRIEFSNDGFVTLNREHLFTYAATDVGIGRVYIVPVNQGEEYRIRYTNGAVAQTLFDLRAELTTTSVQAMTDDIGRGSLLVSPGLRISQVLGRVHQEVNAVGQVASAVLFTVPAGFDYRVTSIMVVAENASIVGSGQIRIRDGGAAGTLKFSMFVEEATASINKTGNLTQGFEEPLLFTTDVFFQIVGGTLTADVVAVGYLESE